MSRMPQVTARELVAFLKSQGFVEDRQSGSHLVLREEDHLPVPEERFEALVVAV